MGKTNTWLDAARMAYREALESARASPTAEAWGKLLAAGKALSSAEEPKSRGGRRSRRAAMPTSRDLEEDASRESPELE
ncbi:MAG: hypothetical protein A2V77_02245 [Anaeromyxobacter sp. RBG_16_69_14]|nr:MAG: hypothetical protein A2V77_02245 [Anaeromyxobacter sp. RBG_16_69_14]